MNTLLQETIALTHAAADQIMRFYQSSFSVADKTPDNPVTDAALAADRRQCLGDRENSDEAGIVRGVHHARRANNAHFLLILLSLST